MKTDHPPLDRYQTHLLWHTHHRSAGGLHRGLTPDIADLVHRGLMQHAGRDHYRLTPAGLDALRAAHRQH